MLHANSYRSFCSRFIGRLINHDDNIPEKSLERYVKTTGLAWNAHNEKRKAAFTAPISETTSGPEIKIGFKSKYLSVLFSIGKNSKSSNRTSKNGFVSEKKLFKGKYEPGTYKSSPTYTPNLSNSPSKEEKTFTDEEGNVNSDYDEVKISFHDKSNVFNGIKVIVVRLTFCF